MTTNKQVRRRKLEPVLHRTKVRFGDDEFTAEAWSYVNPKTRDVYVSLVRDGHTVATVSVRVPYPKARRP
jgi:hypothetical protein